MEAVCVLLDVKATRVKDPSGSGKMIEDYWPSAGKVSAESNGGHEGNKSWLTFLPALLMQQQAVSLFLISLVTSVY